MCHHMYLLFRALKAGAFTTGLDLQILNPKSEMWKQSLKTVHHIVPVRSSAENRRLLSPLVVELHQPTSCVRYCSQLATCASSNGLTWKYGRLMAASNQGLTLVHFSAQPELFLTQNTP